MTMAIETLVVGGTGKTGLRFAERLKARAIPVRISLRFAGVLDGRNEHMADDDFGPLGRQQRDFSDHARDAAATGIREITQ